LTFSLALLSAGCKPEFSDRSSEVAGLRVLAVSSEPAELRPGGKLYIKALLVDERGELSVDDHDPVRQEEASGLDWAYCSQPRPQGELNEMATACLVYAAIS